VAKTRARPGRSRTAADLVLGSWRRTLIAAAAIVSVFAVVIVVTTRLGDLLHANFPGHQYPPAGFYRNPVPGGDELINAADAAGVRADFQEDGRVEVDAFARGDPALLAQSDAGGRLARLGQVIDQNNSVGIVQRFENRIDSLVVGRRPAPTGSAITWFVEEKGTSASEDVAKASGQVLRRQSFRFDGQFWLAKVGDRYVITDAAITNKPLT
jgi:hypothetical protein